MRAPKLKKRWFLPYLKELLDERGKQYDSGAGVWHDYGGLLRIMNA